MKQDHNGKVKETEMLDVFQCLVKDIEQNNDMRTGPVVDSICKCYPKVRDIEAFHALIGYQLDEIKMRAMLAKTADIKTPQQREAYYFWEEIYRTVGNLVMDIRTRWGRTDAYVCCFDIGRYIANCYLRYCVDRKLPDLSDPDGQCYWKPEFGTAQEWMDLCDGIVAMGRHKALVLLERLKVFEKYYQKG